MNTFNKPSRKYYVTTGTVLALCWLMNLPVELQAHAPAPDKKLSAEEISQKFDALDKELTDIRSKLNTLIKNSNSYATRLAKLETPGQSPGQSAPVLEPLQKSVANLEANLASLRTDVTNLQNRLNVAEVRAHYADSINFEILSQLVILESRLVALSNSIGESRTITQRDSGKPDASGQPLPFKERYLNALTLHQNNRNEEAIESFRKLIGEDRGHDLSDNAQYWIGECYYSMKQYQRAIAEFEKVSTFANTDKGDDAQFKIGLCYKQLGNLDRFRIEMQKLIDLYPQSEFVPNATQLIK